MAMNVNQREMSNSLRDTLRQINLRLLELKERASYTIEVDAKLERQEGKATDYTLSNGTVPADALLLAKSNCLLALATLEKS